MYIRVSWYNPQDVQIFDHMPDPAECTLLRIYDAKVLQYRNGDWSVIFESSSLASNFYKACELMVSAFAMQAENMARTQHGQAMAYTESQFDQIAEALEILAAG